MGAYNVGTGRETDVTTLFDMLRIACGSDAAPMHGPAKPGEQQRSCLDASRAAAVLGWTAQVSLEEGLTTTVDWFREVAP
jgi:UDP-glucose 4-epimerase